MFSNKKKFIVILCSVIVVSLFLIISGKFYLSYIKQNNLIIISSCCVDSIFAIGKSLFTIGMIVVLFFIFFIGLLIKISKRVKKENYKLLKISSFILITLFLLYSLCSFFDNYLSAKNIISDKQKYNQNIDEIKEVLDLKLKQEIK